MKFLILTYGSRGDVQPYVALGTGLSGAGHDVMIATSVRFRDFIEDHGLKYGFMGDELLSLVDTDDGRKMLENTKGIFSIIIRTLTMMKKVGPLQRSLLTESFKAAVDYSPDIILFHPKVYGGPQFAEKLNIPVIMALVIPMFVPTSEKPNMGFPDLKMKWFNRLTYTLVSRIMGLSAGKYVKEFRRNNNLQQIKKFEILKKTDGSSIPVVHGFSRHVYKRPSDWPEDAYVTGYWFLESDGEWKPDKELEDFIEKGTPPIYIGFGSMAGRDPEHLTKTVLEALKIAGVRAVIATGWGGIKVDDIPEYVYQVEQVPHDWLFSKMAAIIHHGGAGTTAAALKAGKPSFIVPFFGDQPYWGKLVHDLGAGCKPVPMKRLKVENLVSSIKKITSDKEMIEKSKQISLELKREDGIKETIKIIESIYGKQRE